MSFKKEFDLFKKSLRLDRRFGMIVFLEILFLLAMLLGLYIWANQMESLEPLAQQASLPLSSTLDIGTSFILHNAESAFKELQTRMITYTAILIIFAPGLSPTINFTEFGKMALNSSNRKCIIQRWRFSCLRKNASRRWRVSNKSIPQVVWEGMNIFVSTANMKSEFPN